MVADRTSGNFGGGLPMPTRHGEKVRLSARVSTPPRSTPARSRATTLFRGRRGLRPMPQSVVDRACQGLVGHLRAKLAETDHVGRAGRARKNLPITPPGPRSSGASTNVPLRRRSWPCCSRSTATHPLGRCSLNGVSHSGTVSVRCRNCVDPAGDHRPGSPAALSASAARLRLLALLRSRQHRDGPVALLRGDPAVARRHRPAVRVHRAADGGVVGAVHPEGSR